MHKLYISINSDLEELIEKAKTIFLVYEANYEKLFNDKEFNYEKDIELSNHENNRLIYHHLLNDFYYNSNF